MPAEDLIELCDEMGFMVMCENFDEWDIAKCENGYHRWFNVDSGDGRIWAERDMINLIHHFRNNPSVVMWSIGNEVPSQWAEGGLEMAAWLQNIYHTEDPTRPVTCGMDQFDAVVTNGFAAQLDVVGFNYKARVEKLDAPPVELSSSFVGMLMYLFSFASLICSAPAAIYGSCHNETL